MYCGFMVAVVSKYESALVVPIQVENKYWEYGYVNIVSNYDVLEADYHQFDEADYAPDDVALDGRDTGRVQ